MRIQWNELGRTRESLCTDQKDCYEKHAGYICPSCGLELYGEWWYTCEGVNKSGTPEYKKMQEEALAFSELKECPCCGELLEHTPNYFVQIDSVWGGNDWEKNLLFFFLNDVCRYAPNSSIMGSDAAWQAIWKVNTTDKMFDYLHEQQKELWGKSSVAKVAELNGKFDVSQSITVNPEEVSKIKYDSQKLQEYFLQLINIEKNIHSLKQRLSFLFFASYQASQEATLAQYYPSMSEKQRFSEANTVLESDYRKEANEITELKKRRENLRSTKVATPSVPMPMKPIEPAKPIYVTASLFNKKKIAAENEAKTEKYNAEIALYNKALSEYPTLLETAKKQQEELREKAIQAKEKAIFEIDEKIAEKEEALEAIKKEIDEKQTILKNNLSQLQNTTDHPAIQAKFNLQKEIENATDSLANLFKQRNRLYATNIIFGKYHDLAAITSFYEYLLSGRCEALEGVNGCYNLYESELRANIIINKLDTIDESLEQIKGNQYMLYSQLHQINTELNALNSTTTAMLNGIRDIAEVFIEHSAVIAHNSTVSAYYAKLNAEIASADRYISMICW